MRSPKISHLKSSFRSCQKRSASFLALLAAFVLVLVCRPASAQIVPVVERPIILSEGIGELSLDVKVGLNADRPGAASGLDSGMASDRAPGLSVAYGAGKRVEVGASVPYIFANYNVDLIHAYNTAMKGWPLRRDLNSKHHFGPVQVWSKVKLVDWVAVDIALGIPLENFRANRVGFRVGLPMKWTLVQKKLALRFQPDLMLGIGRADMNLGAKVQLSFFADVSLLWNPLPYLYLELGLGYGRLLTPAPKEVLRDWHAETKPTGGGYLPIYLSLGYSIIEIVDIKLGFSLDNLTSLGSPVEARSLTLSATYRF